MTQELLDFVIGLRWQDWLTIASFVFGTITLIAYIEQRRSAAGTATLAKWAQRNLDKTISEEEIKNLIAQKAAMEDQITQNIPALARVAVLKEQAELHRKAIVEHFSAWQQLTNELESSTPVPGLEPQIQDAILDRIVPRYQQEQEVMGLRTRITVLSVGVAGASALLPFGLDSMVAFIFAPALVTAAFRLYALTEDPAKTFKSLRSWVHTVYLAAALGLGGYGVLLLFWGNYAIARYSGWTLLALGTTLLSAYRWTRISLDRWLTTLTNKR